MVRGQIDYNPAFDYRAFCERMNRMNLKDSIVNVVKEVIADAENSGVAQQVETLMQTEVAKLESTLKAYVDAKFAEVVASLAPKPPAA